MFFLCSLPLRLKAAVSGMHALMRSSPSGYGYDVPQSKIACSTRQVFRVTTR